MTQKIRNTKEYKEFRKKVLERDKNTCQNCGSKKQLEVHHIKSVSEYPELALDIKNAITYCKNCHSKTESYLKYQKGLKREQEKKKKLVTLNKKVLDMLEKISDLTGSTDNQVIAMGIAVLYAQLMGK